MKQSEFFSSLLPLAQKAGEAFRINPAVILAQAAIESGWGQSDLASEYHNYFGITAYGRSNVWWKGQSIELGTHSLRFRVYDTPGDSFMDYARLIRSVYPVRRRRQRRPKSLRPQNRLQQIHQRSQQRQPCRLSGVVGQGLQEDREKVMDRLPPAT